MRPISIVLALLSFITLFVAMYYGIMEYIFTALLAIGLLCALCYLWDFILTNYIRTKEAKCA